MGKEREKSKCSQGVTKEELVEKTYLQKKSIGFAVIPLKVLIDRPIKDGLNGIMNNIAIIGINSVVEKKVCQYSFVFNRVAFITREYNYSRSIVDKSEGRGV
ncbi:hypothetical protein V1478_009276 [Vespula squamosa]|uniref:Uncharacterized protein n=1 Tax=Vespula squamosa TaxID=30214 RepID=A0ABD2AP68_VESSQ